MTRLATSDDGRFAVSDLELRRAGVSFTSDTLADLHALDPGAELFLVLWWSRALAAGRHDQRTSRRRVSTATG
jgi:hypothetical protein